MWQIARKEVLLNLLGLRFALGTAICVAMMGVVGYVQLGEYTARQQAYIADVQNHESELADTRVYSGLTVTVDFPPSPLSMFSQGVRDLPSSVRVSPYHERWRERQAKEGYDVLWTDILTWDKIEPLDLVAMPRAVIRSPDLGERVAAATTDMALLLVFTAAAVILMGRNSLRCPVL